MKSIFQKKFACIVLIVCLFVSMSTPVYAIHAEDTISVDEYYEMVKAEYEKYGIGYTQDSTNLLRPLTVSDLEKAIDMANYIGENLEITSEPSLLSDSVQASPEVISPRYIEDNFKYTGTWRVVSGSLYFAKFEVIVSGRVDVLGSNIMGFDSYRHVMRNSLNYDHVEFTSNTVTDLGNANVRWYVAGDCYFSYTEPTTGINQQISLPFTKSGTFSALDYLV